MADLQRCIQKYKDLDLLMVDEGLDTIILV